MKVSRTIEASGLVVTHFGGKHSLDDAMDALHELNELHKDKDAVYELVFHDLDLETDITPDINDSLRQEMKNVLSRFQKGAIAFIAKQDLYYGLCRQVQMMLNEKVKLAVFREETEAREWVEALMKYK